MPKLNDQLSRAKALCARRKYSESLAIVEQILAEHASKDSIEDLISRAKKLKVDIDAKRRRFHERFWVLLFFTISLLVVGALHFQKVSSTEVIIDINSRYVYLELENASSFESSPVDEIILNQTENVEVYAETLESLGENNENSQLQGSKKDLVPTLPTIIDQGGSLETIKISGDYLRLQRFELNAGKHVELSSSGNEATTITIKQGGTDAYGTVDAGREIFVECLDCRVKQLEKEIAGTAEQLRISLSLNELRFFGGEHPLGLSLVFENNATSNSNNVFNESIKLASIAFTESGKDNPYSLIHSGTIKFTELDDEVLILTEGGSLIVEGLTEFHLTSLKFDNPMQLQFRGKVSSIMSGSGSVLYSRMPSVLEWIVKNQPLSLFIASVSAIFSFIVAALVRLDYLTK